ncbi:MAG: hypothetical protein ACOX1P_04510 [Thermoguttaceae bacterium]|jgi:hypothetical protein
MLKVCNSGKTHGLTVRVPREIDSRRFPAVPRATKKFERLYKGRTAVERVNARLKIFCGALRSHLACRGSKGPREFFIATGSELVPGWPERIDL